MNNYWKKYWTESKIIKQANPHLQVGRAIMGIPINEELWQQTLSFLSNQLELNKNDRLLDIASGSGMISIPFSKNVKSICSIDISEKLFKNYNNYRNIQTITADIRDYDFKAKEFSKIIFYFAIQHFTMEESVYLFEKIHKWLSPGGIAYIGDIPDIKFLFKFFDTIERETDFFNSLKKDRPIIGTWYSREFLLKLGNFTGFEKVEIIEQPTCFINAHYRFDLKLSKKK
jgi:cyclopropane fatty-acyl-phospholipid synthase-like methyltransferase